MANSWPASLIITCVFHVLTFAFVVGRLAILIQKRQLHLGDWMLGTAWILTTTQWSLLLVSFHTSTPSPTHSHHILFASYLFYSPVATLLKISAACMLLRVQTLISNRTLLSLAILLLQVLPSATSLIFQLAQCRPLSSTWNPALYPNATCVSPKSTLGVLYFEAGTGTATSTILLAFSSILLFSKSNPTKTLPLPKPLLIVTATFALFSISANLVRTAHLHSFPFPLLLSTSTTTNTSLTLSQWALLELESLHLALLTPLLSTLFSHSSTLAHRFSLHSHASSSSSPSPSPEPHPSHHHSHPHRRREFDRISSNDATTTSTPQPKPPSSKHPKQKKKTTSKKQHDRTRTRTPTLPFIPTPSLKTTIANINRVTTTTTTDPSSSSSSPTPIPIPPNLTGSAETIWPTAPSRREDEDEEDLLAGAGESVGSGSGLNGGILMTTEFMIRSECVSRMPSRDDVLGV